MLRAGLIRSPSVDHLHIAVLSHILDSNLPEMCSHSLFNACLYVMFVKVVCIRRRHCRHCLG